MSTANPLGKYQPYPEYKDSGVEWLGYIPKHWMGLPCRAGVNHLVKKNTDGKEDNYLSLMANIGIVLYEDKGDVGNKKPDDLTKCKLVRKGNLVINSMNYAIGSYGMSPYDGVCSPVYIILDANMLMLEQRYALRLFENKPFQKKLAILGNGILEHRAAISWDDIKGQYIPFPPLQEQRTIAAFLDYETARIDQLIAKQQQLIGLLKEKRQAVISHAVTKGLNPNAPMKDSGVEWLGQVPEHWVVRRLKHHIVSMDQGWSPQCEARLSEEGEFGVMKVGCVNGGIFKAHEHKALPAELEPKTEYRLKKGQLLVSRANTRELVGSAAVVDADYENLLLCDKLYRIKLSSDVSPEFVALLLGTLAYRGQIELSASGASDSMQNIGQSTIKELPIAIPPFNEANNILKYLASKLATFDYLNSQLHQQNLLLQERRTALIAAAVTGKMDLRGWRAPVNEVAA